MMIGDSHIWCDFARLPGLRGDLKLKPSTGKWKTIYDYDASIPDWENMKNDIKDTTAK
jgi:hypothetical protein